MSRSGIARAASLAALVLIMAGPVAAQGPSGDAPDSGDTLDGLVQLVDQTTWVDPDGEIVVRFRLDPEQVGELPEGATVEVVIHELLRDRTDFDRTLTRERLGGRLRELDLGSVADLDPASTGSTIGARIPIRSGPPTPDEPDRLGIANAGVYPIDISINAADRGRLGGFTTHVIRLPIETDDPPLSVVLVQPLPSDPSRLPDGTIQIDAQTRTDWSLVVSGLDDDQTDPVVLAPRPEALDALASADAPLDQLLLRQLATLAAGHTLPLLPSVDIDVDGLDRAGLADEIDRQLTRGATTTELRIGAAADATLWVADADLTTRALGALIDRGITQLIVPHRALDRRDDEDTDADPTPFWLRAPEAGRVRALATHPSLQRHQGSTDDPLLDAQRLLADLAVVWFEDPEVERATAVLLDGLDPDPAFLGALRAGIAASPLLAARTPDDVLTGSPSPSGSRTLADAAGDADLGPLRRDLDLARLSLASFAGVFPDSTEQAERFDDLLAITASTVLTETERSSYFQALAVEMESGLEAIGLPERRAITLPAREGTIPVTLTNNSGQPAVVSVRLASDKLEFPDGERVEVALPDGGTTIEIDVRARASGAFPLDIVVESPDTRIELGTARYTVRSTAVSGVGVGISVAAILVLGVWWARTARRAKAAHRPDAGASPDAEASTGA